MLDLYQEFRAVAEALEEARIPYAVCGGLAVSIYAQPRATVDVDLLILVEDYGRTKDAVRQAGFTLEADPMSFASGKVQIRRLTKIEEGAGEGELERDTLMLDLLLASSDELTRIFRSRIRIDWDGRPLWIVSREGLIALKKMRDSDQDRVDILRLEESL